MEASYVARPNVYLFFFFSFLLLAQSCLANIVELDDHWQKRAEASRVAARAAYIEEPEEVNHEINEEVHKTLEGGMGNQTRRSLRRKYNGPCLATNPIDRCWRCDPKWTNHRKRLANCVLGFGRHTVGGKHGKYYVVTDASDYNVEDPTPGTLRHAVIQDEPLWIIFKHDMIIRLQQELIMNSDKTIDARGVNVHIAYGAGITIQYVHNIILHGLHIHDIKSASGGIIINSPHHKGIRGRSDGDGISIFGATNIWIDHISMSNCEDGLIDAVQGSTALTISNNHFTKHNDVMLLGASDSFSGDKIMQATIAFNHFGRRLIQRMPRCRWGFFHVLNNDYTHYEMYAIGGSQNPTIISQGNRFVAPHNAAAKEVTKREYTDMSIWKSWKWRSDGDLMLNGAFFVESGNDPKLRYHKKDFIKAKSGTFVTRLTRFSGALVCKPNKPC